MAPTRIVLITTGGTVASTTGADGAVPMLSAEQLLSTAYRNSETRTQADLDLDIATVDLMSVDSSAMTVAHQVRIVAAIAHALADPAVTAVVVTHGTDTMEETAFLADLTAADPRPVVFTGAQFPADSPHPDGPANIGCALRAAADPHNRGRGVLIAVGGRLVPARGAFKASTNDPTAFDTVCDRLPRPLLPAPMTVGRVARVDAFTLYPGVSPSLIASAVDQRAGAIVLAGTGSGNTHPDITAEVIGARQAGVIVVVTTRVPYGPVIPTYGGGGGAVDLERAGALVSRWLRAPQARTALIALLSTGHDADDVARFFRESEPDLPVHRP
ncbi:MAG: asparaginase [Gordonia sp. (in: high G+C Gram-positive bacteria)]